MQCLTYVGWLDLACISGLLEHVVFLWPYIFNATPNFYTHLAVRRYEYLILL